jgi:hypothetical protein
MHLQRPIDVNASIGYTNKAPVNAGAFSMANRNVHLFILRTRLLMRLFVQTHQCIGANASIVRCIRNDPGGGNKRKEEG